MAGHCNPPPAAKVVGGVLEPEFAGGTPSPHKKARCKEASFLFRLNCKKASAAAKGGHDVETKAITKDDLDNDEGASVVIGPDREKAFAAAKVRCNVKAEAVAKDNSDNDKGASVIVSPNHEKAFAAAKGGRNVEAKAVAKDDSDDNEGASVGRPRCKTRAIKGGCGAVVVTGWPRRGRTQTTLPIGPAMGSPKRDLPRCPPRAGVAPPLKPPSAGAASPSRLSTKMA